MDLSNNIYSYISCCNIFTNTCVDIEELTRKSLNINTYKSVSCINAYAPIDIDKLRKSLNVNTYDVMSCINKNINIDIENILSTNHILKEFPNKNS